ncbi:MAG: VOC family protein [Chitinispirillaceae bacterium]|nr:VOC family protein [Chitinispirillaceae bacterium]
MILGVDHIALSTYDIDESVRQLSLNGYIAKFVEPALSNHHEKKPFLAHYLPLHAMAYCRCETCMSIELLQHARGPGVGKEEDSCYKVLFAKTPSGTENARSDADPIQHAFEKVFNLKVEQLKYPHFHTPIWASEEQPGGNPRISALAITASDPERSLRFWTSGIGARCVDSKQDNEYFLVRLGSLVKNWRADLVLLHTASEKRPLLDDPGFTCLALLSTDIDRDADKAVSYGARERTGVFDLQVNNRNLKLALLRGPDNELVELVQMEKK